MRPNKFSDNIFTNAAAVTTTHNDKHRFKTTDYEPVAKGGHHHKHSKHVGQHVTQQLPPPPPRQYLVSFREGATKPSDLFGSLKKMVGGKKLTDQQHGDERGHDVIEDDENGGKTKCQCRHHLKKMREQNRQEEKQRMREQTKLDEQRYTRALLSSASNVFNQGEKNPFCKQPLNFFQTISHPGFIDTKAKQNENTVAHISTTLVSQNCMVRCEKSVSR
jgi:hypothetical protein